jgi:hypothetical protein
MESGRGAPGESRGERNGAEPLEGPRTCARCRSTALASAAYFRVAQQEHEADESAPRLLVLVRGGRARAPCARASVPRKAEVWLLGARCDVLDDVVGVPPHAREEPRRHRVEEEQSNKVQAWLGGDDPAVVDWFRGLVFLAEDGEVYP